MPFNFQLFTFNSSLIPFSPSPRVGSYSDTFKGVGEVGEKTEIVMGQVAQQDVDLTEAVIP